MTSARRSVSVETLVDQLWSLGVRQGDVLLAHTSFSAVRPVQGGPAGLIEALMRALGPSGTLVMPSWPEHGDRPFDPATTEVAHDLGVVAREFWRLPGVARSTHVHAFAAIGPQAHRILSDPLPIPPHRPESPVGRVHELGGRVLLLGVNHDADTTIHLAEVYAGVPYGRPKRCASMVDGRFTLVAYLENDHCCQRFRRVDDWLREAGTQSEGSVGHAKARLAQAESIVSAVVSRLREDPLFFLHDRSAKCDQCDEARAYAAPSLG